MGTVDKQRFVEIKVAVTTTGANGSATGSADTPSPVNGKLHAVYLDYHGSAPNTTDVTISQKEGPTQTLLTVTDNATDGWKFPREQVHSNAGAGLTYDGSHAVAEAPPVTGKLTVSVAQSNALTGCVTAWLYIET